MVCFVESSICITMLHFDVLKFNVWFLLKIHFLKIQMFIQKMF